MYTTYISRRLYSLPTTTLLSNPYCPHTVHNTFDVLHSTAASQQLRGYWMGLSDALSKPANHYERRVVPYSAEQYFDVVLDVNKYQLFLPWCQVSRILPTAGPHSNSFIAELEIGYKLFKEKYRSLVTFERPHFIKVAAADSCVFSNLVNEWRFTAGPTPTTTEVEFQIQFQFYNIIHQHTAGFFLKEIAASMASCFDERVSKVYGKLKPHPTLVGDAAAVDYKLDRLSVAAIDRSNRLAASSMNNDVASSRDNKVCEDDMEERRDESHGMHPPCSGLLPPVAPAFDGRLTPREWAGFLLRVDELAEKNGITEEEGRVLRRMTRKALMEIAIVFLAYDPVYNKIENDTQEFISREASLVSNLKELANEYEAQ